MILNAGTYEFIVMTLLGASGIALGLLAGIRNPVILASTAVGFGSLIRLWTALGLWLSGNTTYLLEAWYSIALVSIVAAAIHWRQWRSATGAFVLFMILAGSSFLVKYALQIGEMQHVDSAGIVSRALLIIQTGSDNLQPISDYPTRGLLYPLLLALGPLGRIFSAVTPLLFFSTALLTVWLSWKLTEKMMRVPRFVALAVVLGFLVSVPIIRISVTYLNSHILVAFGLSVMVVAVMLSIAEGSYTWPHMALFTMGGMVAVTSRVEAIVLVVVIAVMFASVLPQARDTQLKFFTSLLVVGGAFLAWLTGLNTPIFDRFGFSLWILAATGTLGAAILSSGWIDPIRHLVPHLLAGVLSAYFLWLIFEAANPQQLLLTQWPNFGLGAGGWATAAPVLLVVLIILGWRSQDTNYKWILRTAGLALLATLLSKTFDGAVIGGGFGRESFYDSVNRMVLHLLPLVVIASVTGTSRIFDRSFFSLTNSRQKDPHGAS